MEEGTGLARSSKPHGDCNSTKEELREDGLKVMDDCPICQRRGVLCEVGAHPSAPSAVPAPGIPSELEEKIDGLVNTVDQLSKSVKELAVDHNLSNYDIWTETGRTEQEQQEFKDGLIVFYNRGARFTNQVQCMMTNEWHRRDYVIAEHIWKHKMHGNGLHKFNLERKDAGSPRNGILMLKDIENQFTVKNLCVIYDSTRKKFIIRVLNPDIMDNVITHSRKTFRDIHNTKLCHPKKCFPFRRLLSFHARCAYKVAREKGWITVEEENLFEPYHNLSDTASVPSIE